MRNEYSAFLAWLREQGAQFPDGVYFADGAWCDLPR